MRTLVISDLHLGAPSGRDVLRRDGARATLLARLAGFDRLVLLGDVIELRHAPLHEALASAQQALAALGEALGAEREVVIVPGNHDYHLLSAWLERRARDAPRAPLDLQTAVDWRAGETLATVVQWLAPARVSVVYPGIWLREDVYAMHGHYSDRHTTVPMLERLAAGAIARVVTEPRGGPRQIGHYEATLAPIYAWIHAVVQNGGLDVGGRTHGISTGAWSVLAGGRARGAGARLLAAAFPAAVAGLNRAGIGPLRSDLSAVELRRAGLRAFGEVVDRLRPGAEQVVFGHTHRAGPLPGEDGAQWRSALGCQLLNSGSWVDEPGFLGSSPERSPYRAGFAVELDEQGPPRLVNLLDEQG
ncbi:MAG: metallophosphoesterase family protein [Solirubrobacterales bacterium]|nr:metallophosphoesterase family protein [Solirubrobacterales bacterium]